MSYHIRTTPESEATFYQNIDYLTKEWDVKVTDEFIDRVNEVVQEIKLNPFLFPLSGNRPDVRRAVINKRIILYYRITNATTLELLTFWNTSRNPNDLKL